VTMKDQLDVWVFVTIVSTRNLVIQLQNGIEQVKRTNFTAPFVLIRLQ
jgi:hypothetical protein